jgi:biopolymer transport protein ExbB/TolQ
MQGYELTEQEKMTLVPGAGITLAAVMAVLAIAITAVVVYRMFRSGSGSAKMPGGWQFTWK